MFPFFDSHAHLADPAFADDQPDVVARARVAGAVGMLCVGESLPAAERARVLADAHPGFVWASAGVHPHDAAAFDGERDVDGIRALAARGAVAVGECGLDYHYDHSPRDAQRAAFAAQLELAAELTLPTIVHTREAEPDTRDLVLEAARAGVRGVLHCYTGSAALAEAALGAGWYVSFSGIVTFKRWADDALLRLVPDDRLLVESDAPYLAPVPNRGRRNEPAWVAHTVRRLADVRGVTTEALGNHLVRNARRFFGLADAATAH
jgi:TatD DNase family protein